VTAASIGDGAERIINDLVDDSAPMNVKSPEELVKYRRYTLKMLWGGTMHWFATSRGESKRDGHMPPRVLQDTRHMAEMYFDRFEMEAEKLLADLQSKGDIQITGPEESVLKRRGTDHGLRYIPALRRGKGRKTMFTSIVHLYQAWRRYETVRRELSHLTDRELADIGITRSDIERIASGVARS
jgi:uncharacterized protein YjiS (DUF1127 family)